MVFENPIKDCECRIALDKPHTECLVVDKHVTRGLLFFQTLHMTKNDFFFGQFCMVNNHPSYQGYTKISGYTVLKLHCNVLSTGSRYKSFISDISFIDNKAYSILVNTSN